MRISALSIFVFSFFLNGEVEKTRESELSGRKAPEPLWDASAVSADTGPQCMMGGVGWGPAAALRSPRETASNHRHVEVLCPSSNIPGGGLTAPIIQGGN